MSTNTPPTLPVTTLLQQLEEDSQAEDKYPEDDEISLYTYSLKYEYLLAVKFAICVLGLVGNVLTIRAFLRIGLEDNVTIVFFNLAVSDFNFVNVSLAKIGAALSEYAPVHVFNTFKAHPNAIIKLCTDVFGGVFIVASLYLTTFLAVQRCICVVRPFHFKGMFTRFKTVVIILVIWGVSLVNCLKHFMYFDIKDMKSPENGSSWISLSFDKKWNFYIMYAELGNAIATGLCQVAIVISIVLMAHALKQSARFRQSASTSNTGIQADEKSTTGLNDLDSTQTNVTDSASSKKAVISYKERQVIIQVALVSTILFFAHAHHFFFEMVLVASPQLLLYLAFWDIYFFYQEIRDVLYIVNASVNFFIYYKFNSRFRKLCFKQKEST